MSTLAWIIVFCGFAILICEYLFHLESVRLCRLEKSTTVFYESLDKLLKDKQSPESAIDLFRFLNDRITHPRTAFMLVICALIRKVRPSLARSLDEDRESEIDLDEIDSYYEKRGDDFHEAFMMLMVSAIFTATFSSILFGWLARKLVLPRDLERDRARAPDIISTMTHGAGRRDGYAHA
jgi:hypothetical protein